MPFLSFSAIKVTWLQEHVEFVHCGFLCSHEGYKNKESNDDKVQDTTCFEA
jgi:hypothetical protein